MVSSFSPKNTELAPARKHSACTASDMRSRPAESRTQAFGMVMRAAATVRTNSNASSSSACASGVPATATRALIGTLSG